MEMRFLVKYVSNNYVKMFHCIDRKTRFNKSGTKRPSPRLSYQRAVEILNFTVREVRKKLFWSKFYSSFMHRIYS